MPTAIATAPDALAVSLDWTDPETGVRWISVPLGGDDYAAFRALPQIVSYDGALFARTSWNSDTGRAHYRDRLPVARRV